MTDKIGWWGIVPPSQSSGDMIATTTLVTAGCPHCLDAEDRVQEYKVALRCADLELTDVKAALASLQREVLRAYRTSKPKPAKRVKR